MPKPSKVRSVCVPLDPDDCGSVINGYVRFPELYQRNYGANEWEVEASASVSLSDCSRVIQWNLTGNGPEYGETAYDLAKLDIAIGALMKLREYMVAAENEHTKIQKERKARNALLKE